MPGRPVPGDAVQRARLRGRARRPLAVERRRDPVPGRHRGRRDRLPRHAVLGVEGGPGPGPRGPRARRDLRRRAGLEPLRAQRPHAGRPAPAVQARVARGPADDGRPAGWPTTRTAQVALVGDWNIAPENDDVWDMAVFAHSTHVSPPERAAFRGVVEAGYADVVRPYTPGPGRLHVLGLHAAALPAPRGHADRLRARLPRAGRPGHRRADRPRGAQGQGRQRPRPRDRRPATDGPCSSCCRRRRPRRPEGTAPRWTSPR